MFTLLCTVSSTTVFSIHVLTSFLQNWSDWRGRQHRRLPRAANTLAPPLHFLNVSCTTPISWLFVSIYPGQSQLLTERHGEIRGPWDAKMPEVSSHVPALSFLERLVNLQSWFVVIVLAAVVIGNDRPSSIACDTSIVWTLISFTSFVSR